MQPYNQKNKTNKIYNCSFCYSSFPTIDELFAHEETHEIDLSDIEEEVKRKKPYDEFETDF